MNNLIIFSKYCGPVVFPISLGCQIYKVYIRKSANDISYFWQFLYILGVSMNLVYFIHDNVYITFQLSIILEILLIFILIFQKCYYKSTIRVIPENNINNRSN